MTDTWFRFYASALNDPKVQRLTPQQFKTWVNLLCLACMNNGRLPPVDECAFALRETEAAFHETFIALHNAGLIDKNVTDDETFHIHNWRKRQYKSDSSTERVKRYRKRCRNGDVTAPDTDTDTDIDSSLRSESSAASAQSLPNKQCIDKPDEPDLKAQVFGPCLDWLAERTSRPPATLRPMIGRWCRDHGDGAVLQAVTQAARASPVEPVAWIERVLRGGSKNGPVSMVSIVRELNGASRAGNGGI